MVPFICNFRGENNKAPRFYLGALSPAERTTKLQGFTSVTSEL